jgi:Ran GTPase-activating protein (RanGAP) involved in mRNA processing and transport
MGNCICPSEGVRIIDTQLQLASTIIEYDCKAWRVIHWSRRCYGKGKLQFGLLNSGHIMNNSEMFQLSYREIVYLTSKLKLNEYENITHLSIGHHSLGFDVDKLHAIADMLKVNTGLTQLDLNGNDLGSSGRKGAHIIADALKVNHTLTNIDLAYNHLGGVGAHAIAEALAMNDTITHVNLVVNEMIGDVGTHAIAEALKVNSSIIDINLSCTMIGDEGAHAIADALRTNHTLLHLSVAENKIGGAGVHAISQALHMNHTLIALHIRRNGFGVDGAYSIAEALKNNTSLTTIDISGNGIGVAGAHAIAQALSENCTLTEIDLSWNRLGFEGMCAIAEALKCNTTLRKIEVSDNELYDDGTNVLGEALRVNATLQQVTSAQNHESADTRKRLWRQARERRACKIAGDNALFSIFPSCKEHLWPMPCRDNIVGGAECDHDDDAAIAMPDITTNDRHNALIDSFFSSPIFDVQVFGIIREYLIGGPHAVGFSGKLNFFWEFPPPPPPAVDVHVSLSASLVYLNRTGHLFFILWLLTFTLFSLPRER